MPTIEEIAALLCGLKDLKRIEYARCDAEGNVCVPENIPCCDDKSIELSLMEMLSLTDVASNNCCPENLDLLGQILEALLDDVETSNYTVLCSSTDPATTYLTWFEQPDSTGGSATIVPYHMVLGTNTPIEGMPADGIRCPDTKIVESCFVQNAGGDDADDVYYTRLLCLFNATIISTLWVTPTGDITTTAPTGVVPCDNEIIRDVELVDICGDVGGVESSGYLELIYNADGSLFSSRTLDPELNPVTYTDYVAGKCDTAKDTEVIEICGKNGLVQSNGFLEITYNPDGTIFASRTLDKDLAPTTFDSYDVGICTNCTSNIDTCFLPDQYAIQWAWEGTTGWLQSYDVITGDWTEYCPLIDPDTGVVVRGFALAFENNLTEPRLWFQTGTGDIYYASPLDPCGTLTKLGSSGLTTGQPCFDFDPSGRLLIGDGKKVYEIDQTTGAANFLGNLIDARTGGNLNASPGDWMFGPDGSWYMMASDVSGALYGECTGTVLWTIDPSTLVATRVSDTCSPVGGTGATWLAGGQYLLSTSSGQVYRYNEYEDVWSLLTTAPRRINDLAAQWIIPDPIRVSGKITWNDEGCETELFSLTLNENFEVECNPFEIRINGKFGVCEKEANPFVTDPLDPGSGGGESCDRCPDEVWDLGCSDAGPTYWRRSFDPSGNSLVTYIYGTLTSPTAVAPPGFSAIPCAEIPIYPVTVSEFCDLDTGETVYRREENGAITWFGASGDITEPPNLQAGQCVSTAENETIDTVICLDGNTVIRREINVYVANPDGILELDSSQIIYFDESGTFWDSNVSTDPEPSGWYIGECASDYVSIETERLCEIDDEKLLLIDSGGGFAEYSFFDSSLVNVPLSIASAGGSADPDNFVLYNFISPDQLVVTDVNSKVIVNTITLTGAIGTEPLTFSAASFDVTDGFLYSQFTTGADAGIYRTNVTTGVVEFVTPFSGISGTGTSMAIDFDGRMVIMGSAGRVYEIDRTTGAGTLIYTSPGGIANGATFDADGFLYLTGGLNTYKINLDTGTEENIIDDWTPGANSIAYYRTKAQVPSCFNRKYGVRADGSKDYLSDHFVADDSPRIIAGAIDCCGCGTSGDSGPIEVSNFPVPKVCTPGYRLITGAQTWTPPAGTTSVTVLNVRGNSNTLTTPNGSGVMFQGTSMSWASNDFGELGFTGLSVAGVGTNARIQIAFTVCV